jgi:hypothetical protein
VVTEAILVGLPAVATDALVYGWDSRAGGRVGRGSEGPKPRSRRPRVLIVNRRGLVWVQTGALFYVNSE